MNSIIKKEILIDGLPISEYTIIRQNGQAAEHAANELAAYLEKTTGMRLPVAVDTEAIPSRQEILVGRTNRETDPSLSIDRSGFTGIAEDGFVIAVKEGRLLLTGGNDRGTFYAVYEFLEKILGWRFFTEDCEILTGDEQIDIPAHYWDCQTPLLEYRDTHWKDYFPVAIRVKRKLNTGPKWAPSPDETWGGTYDYVGNPGHSMSEICNIDNATAQPCFTDPLVLQQAIDWVRKTADAHPGARIISVTQNDNWNYCRCERCQKVYEEEGAPSGAVIRFVNAVADAVKEEYPLLSIDTFAYQWTRKAPKLTKPRNNVIVRLCTGGECRSHRYNDKSCHFNQELEGDLKAWAAITNRLFVWDYTTNYSYFLCPFPNFEHLLHNLQWMRENHMSGIFSQGNHIGSRTEFGPLRAYLLAKITWNPEMSDEEYDAHINDFMAGYYGAGWRNVRRYFDFIHTCSRNRHVTIYGRPEYVLERAKYVAATSDIDGWFDAAEKAAEPGEQRDRVYRLRLSHIFVKLWFTFDDRVSAGGAERAAAIEEHKAYYFAVRAFDLCISEGHPFPKEVNFEKGVKSWYAPYEWELGSEFLEVGEKL